MAFKVNGRYFGARLLIGGVESFDAELTDVRPSNARMDCKYCYTDDAPTVASYEEGPRGEQYVQALCGLCAAGLTEPEPAPPR